VKRTFDVIVALSSLLLLAPVFLAIAIWVRLDSHGPVFFRQERVGRNGRSFRICKFRTMHVQSERAGPQITIGQDVRITQAGKTLRAYKVDELPQLWNVLCGNMSLVGPRPEVPDYVAIYPPEIRDRVLSVRPGITDPASIEFFDEAALLANADDPERHYRQVVLPRKLSVYCSYVDNHGFVSDLHILINTIFRIARH